jgi:hypothetical protein
MMDSRWAKQVGNRAERLRDRVKALAWNLKRLNDEKEAASLKERNKINDELMKHRSI